MVEHGHPRILLFDKIAVHVNLHPSDMGDAGKRVHPKSTLQVLNEFTLNARNPNKLGLGIQEELQWIESWLLFPVHPITADTFLNARLFHERYQVSHWDGLILAAAKEALCEKLFSEDLQNGQIYDGIEVINPFV